MDKPVNPYNTEEYSRWLEARHERPEQPMFVMRHYDRGMGVMEEIAVRVYEAVDRFLELVEGDIDYLRLQWKHQDNMPGDPTTYCSFRVFVKARAGNEVECGYDDPPTQIAMDDERRQAFDAMVENCELVDPDVWNHLVGYKIFNAGQIPDRDALSKAKAEDTLDDFIAARQQWLLEWQTRPAATATRPMGRM